MKDGDAKIDQYLATGREAHQRLEDRLGTSATAISSTATGCCAPPAAKAGIYGNDAAEATYPMTKTLADGSRSTAAKHNYTLTFPAGAAAAQ